MKFFVIILFVFFSCKSNRLFYTYDENIEKSILRGLNQFDSEGFHRYYAIITDDMTTKIFINPITDKPNLVDGLLKRTNRYIKVSKYTIPVIFYTDFESTYFKKTSGGRLGFGGYLVEYDYHKEVLFEGIQF